MQNISLSEYEYALYTALLANDSAKELLENKDLKALARELTKTIKENTTIDWYAKESTRVQLKLEVKKLLKRYGYPPDLEQMVIDNILEQAEGLAQNFIVDDIKPTSLTEKDIKTA